MLLLPLANCGSLGERSKSNSSSLLVSLFLSLSPYVALNMNWEGTIIKIINSRDFNSSQ